MTTTLIPWRDVPLTSIDGEAASAAERIECLRRYRDEGGIPDWWLATPDEVEATDDDELPDLGPRVEQIDWTGFPS